MARLVRLALLALLVVKTAAFSCLLPPAGTNDPVECRVLGDLYSSTNGAGWANNSGWASAAAGACACVRQRALLTRVEQGLPPTIAPSLIATPMATCRPCAHAASVAEWALNPALQDTEQQPAERFRARVHWQPDELAAAVRMLHPGLSGR